MQSKNIVLFDGVCNLCNGLVSYLIKLDKNKTLFYCSLQSETGKKLLAQHHLNNLNLNSIVFISHQTSVKSTAVLRILYQLGGFYRLTLILLVIPSFIRDWVYDIVAKKRYLWFGKSKSCRIPNEEEQAMFIE